MKVISAIRKVLGVVIYVLAIGYMIYTRFANPALTETQLLVNFLPQWLAMIALCFFAVYLYRGKITK